MNSQYTPSRVRRDAPSGARLHLSPRRTAGRAVASVLALLLGVASVLVPAVSASAADPSALRNTKTASVSNVVAGQSFNWIIEVGCSVLTDDCVNATLTDLMPDAFILGDPSSILVTGADPVQNITIAGQLITIAFKQPLTSPAGSVGLRNGILTVTIPVTVRSDLDYTPVPLPVSNTSNIVADNAPALASTASVSLTVPLQLAAAATKSFAPASNITPAGVPTTLTLGGTNTSNTPVDTLVVQDPVTPAAGNIFGNTLLFQSPLGTVTWPTGATVATVALWDNSLPTPAWVSAAPVAVGGTLAYPAGVALANARGVRITFTSGATAAIPRTATTSFTVALQNRSGLAAGSVSNTSQATVLLGANAATGTATKTYTLTAASTAVTAGKAITPTRLATVAYGSSDLTTGTTTLTAGNGGSVSLKLLTVLEPSVPSSLSSTNPLAPAHIGGGLIFSGFTTGVVWPAGATGVSVTYYYETGATSTQAGTTVNKIPVPSIAARVTGFAVSFTGTIPPSATATLPFTITANPLQVAPLLSVAYSNTITVNGTDVFSAPAPPKTATANVTVLADQLSVTSTKTNSTPTLPAAPGQSTTVTLGGGSKAYPDSTRSADRIEIVDPSVETGLTDWYKYFDATQITATQVPGGSTLTVQYRDSAGTYTDIPGFVDLPPNTYTQPFPPALLDSIYGIKFIWKSTTGFPPGSNVTGNLRYALRSVLRGTATPLPNADLSNTLKNCSATTAVSGSVSSPTVVSPCINVDLKATTGGGGADLIDKDFIITGAAATPQDIIITRNSNTTRTRLAWSTGGYTNVTSMQVYDGPVDANGNPDPTSWAQKGMFDAFDLQQIPSITAALDPLGQYDRVSIELYNRVTNAWDASGGCTMVAPCTMPQPARTLNATDQDRYVAIRFTFTERPGRTGVSPAVGSGVASSVPHNRRIDLIFVLRNALRSSPTTPVVTGYRYNVDVPVTNPPSQSSVLNATHATATLATEDLVDRATDTITLQDPNLLVNATKVWAGGDLPIPDASVPITAPRPTGRVTLTGVNQTAGIVQSLTIQEPNPGPATPDGTPFEAFDLLRFVSIAHPAGATGLTLTVAGTGLPAATGTPVDVTTTALAYTPAQLANATGFTMVYTGSIAATNATSTVVFDLALRRTLRTSGNPVTAADSPVFNSTQATVADQRFDPSSSPTAPTFITATLAKQAEAFKNLFADSIGVSAAKVFAPDNQTEPIRTPVRTTLSATPTGTERVRTVTITDDRASFWNAFDYVALATTAPVFTLPVFSPSAAASAAVLQPEFCTGRTLTAAGVAASPAAGCVATGGTWTVGAGGFQTQASITANGLLLPTGVTAVQVQGVRFTVRRLDSSQWENPQAPTVSVPLLTQRRLALRTGGDVLTDYVLNAPSPGEAAKGVTTNTVVADIVGIWDKTATSSATATYLYKHSPSGVEVKKTPSGAKAPGQTFDYQLTMKNTGQWPILNPVVTDYLDLATDASGAMLVFDPDKPWVYTFSLSGSAPVPANGTPLPVGTLDPLAPVNPAKPTVTVLTNGPGPQKITFTFPGTLAAPPVLEIGQTYVITIPMMFRPGLVYSTPVVNSFGIKGDRQFNTCTAPTGFTAALDPATGECTTTTTVVPAQQAALRAFESVKAIVDTDFPVDQGFIGGTDASCTAAKDAAGYSRLPCIPLTLPGQKEVWRLTAQNTGTTELTRLVLATRLPAPGDKTILDGFLRKSAWTAGFVNDINVALGNPNATVRTYYTTKTVPCPSVLTNPDNLNACGTDPATGWAPLTGAVDPTTVTALQFVIDFASSRYFRPGESITVDVPTRTAALSSAPGPNTTANGSLSASAKSITGSVLTTVTALDYSRVSVGLVTGSVRLDKAISGPGASFVPSGQTFTGQLVCTSLTSVTTRPFTFTFNGTAVVPAFLQFDDLPGGASCTATETAASGQTSFTASTVIVDPKAAVTSLPTVKMVNDYRLAGLTVGKTVSIDPVVEGSVPPTGFSFTVACTFLGQTLTLAAADAAFTLDGGQTRTITGLPARSVCTVVEVDAKGAGSTVLTGQTDSANGGVLTLTDPTRTAVFTLSPNTIADAPVVTNSVNFNNRFADPALLVLQKLFAGDGAAQFGKTNTAFTVHVRCVFGTTLPVQFDQDVSLTRDSGWKATVAGILSGSVCTITEPSLLGADAVVITPNNGTALGTGVVTIPASSVEDPTPTVAVSITNWYLTGSVRVTKVFAGNEGAVQKFGIDSGVEFVFSLTCTRDGVDVTIPGTTPGTVDRIRTVTAASPVADYTGLASGADCVLTETGTGGAGSTRVTDENGTTIEGGAFTVAVKVPANLANLDPADQPQPPLQVENTYRFADVSAAKIVAAPALDAQGRVHDYGQFEFTLACTLDGAPIDAAEPAARKLSAGETVTWTELAENADCTVTETDARGASTTTYLITVPTGTGGTPQPGRAAVLPPLRPTGDPTPNRVTFTNSYALAYTGETRDASVAMLPIGLLLTGGVLLGFTWLRRRRTGRV